MSQDPLLNADDRPQDWPDTAPDGGDAPLPGDPLVLPMAGAAARLPPPPLLRGRAVVPPSAGLALLQIALCSGLPTQFLVMAAMAMAGFKPAASSAEWSIGYVGTLLLIDSILVVGLTIVFLRIHGERPGDVFFDTRPWLGEVIYGVILIPLVFLMVAIVGLIVQRYAPSLHQEENPFQTLIKTPYGIYLVGGMSILVGGVREEIQRAFVLHRFTQMGIPVIGLLVFSLVFGLGHAVQGWDATIITTLLGLTWGVVYLRRRSLIAPGVCHAAFDVIQVIAFGLMA